jgi:hypothetical protein
MLIGGPQQKSPAAVSGAGHNSTHPISPLSQMQKGRKNKNALSPAYSIGATNSADTRSASQTLSLPRRTRRRRVDPQDDRNPRLAPADRVGNKKARRPRKPPGAIQRIPFRH